MQMVKRKKTGIDRWINAAEKTIEKHGFAYLENLLEKESKSHIQQQTKIKEHIILLTSNFYQCDVLNVGKRKKDSSALAKKMLILLLKKHLEMTDKDIGEVFISPIKRTGISRLRKNFNKSKYSSSLPRDFYKSYNFLSRIIDEYKRKLLSANQ